MSLLPKINFRRILVVFLVQITLFLGLASDLGNNNSAFALDLNTGTNSIKSEKTTTIQSGEPINQAEYEDAKARRREAQARRSAKAGKKGENKNIEEKLNLDELTPDINGNKDS